MASIFKLALEADDETPIVDTDTTDEEVETVEETTEEVTEERTEVKPDVTSGEEESIDADEVVEAEKALVKAVNDYANAKADAARTVETAEYLEDLANTVREIDEISPTDRALIQTNLNMAVAGTDVDATEIAPGMESLMTGAMAAESIMDKVREITGNIKETVKRISAALVAFIKSVVTVLANDEDRINAALRKLDKSGEKKTETVEFSKSGFYISQNGKPVTNPEEYIKAAISSFDSNQKAIKAAADTAALEKVATWYNKYEQSEKLHEDVFKEVNKYVSTIVNSFKNTKKDSGKFFNTYSIKPEVGAVSIDIGVWKDLTFLKEESDNSDQYVKYNSSALEESVQMTTMGLDDLKDNTKKLLEKIKDAQVSLKNLNKRIEATWMIIFSKGVQEWTKDEKMTIPFIITAGVVDIVSELNKALTMMLGYTSKSAVNFVEKQTAAYA